MKLVIICVETNERANTDPCYIDKVIRKYYRIDNSIRLSYKYLDSKTQYKNKKTLQEISKDCKVVGIANSFVVYCIDTDNYNSNYEDTVRFSEIEEFCSQKGFSLVWFCKDIEDVFLHKKIPNHEKKKVAIQFSKSKNTGLATENDFKAKSIFNQKSNILNVFDNILVRK